jgi:hypothetical protein
MSRRTSNVSVMAHDGTVLPSMKAASAYYGGTAYKTLVRNGRFLSANHFVVDTDPRAGAHGIRVILPDGTTRRSLSALARECGCTSVALYRYATQRTADTIWLSALPTKGKTQ